MRVASGTGPWNEGPLAGLCLDGLKAEFWKDPPAVKVVPSGQQDACGSCAPASWEGMNAKAATAVAQRRLEWRPHTIS